MERRRLADDLSISPIVTGLWQIADMERAGELDPEATSAELVPYVDAGLTTFDMADHYGSAEVIVGQLAQGPYGARIEALTKWVPRPGPVTPDAVRSAVELALRRLRAERLDLLQFHAWSYADPAYLDALFHLQELREEGLIHHLGLTNFDTAHLRLVLESGIDVVSNQVCFSLLDRRPLAGMARLCEERGVAILAYGVLAGGLLTERFLGRPDQAPDELATWSQRKYRRFVESAGGWECLQTVLRAIRSVAERHGVSMANVAGRYVLDQPGVRAILIGARLGESRHVEDNIRTLELELSADDRATLDEALGELHPIPGDCGDEYRRPPFLTAAGDLSDHFDAFPPPFRVAEGGGGRRRAYSGTSWEEIAGFARAVRHGNRISVSGTTATHGERLIGGSDPAAQTHFVLDKIEGALRSLGGELADVVRTRVFVRRASDWEPVARAHGERFAGISPANTLVEARLVGEEYLVEIEAEAVLDRIHDG